MSSSLVTIRTCRWCGVPLARREDEKRHRFAQRVTCNRACARQLNIAAAQQAHETRGLDERFWEKVDKRGTLPIAAPDLGPCWEWTACLDADGYGRFTISRPSRRLVYAHRLAYELLVGPIPAGLTIDHLCRNKRCVNPAHLEPVSTRENTRRFVEARAAKRTHCKHGHPWTDENTYEEGGAVRCRVCRNERRRKKAA